MENGTQFSDLPPLVIDILLRLPIETLSICRYVRKDWTRLYFSDPDFIRRHLETSKIQYLNRRLEEGRKFRFGCFVDEVSTANLRIESLDFSCKLLDDDDPTYNWCVANSCNGLVCLVDGKYGAYSYTPGSSRICVCNPILGESVSIPYPKRVCFLASRCALGFSAKSNEYKILLCITHPDGNNYRWEIYTLGARRGWRSIVTEENLKPWDQRGLSFNTFIHGALHWTYKSYREGARAFVLQSFDFETERFRVLSLPEPQTIYTDYMGVALGVINGCLWASFHDSTQNNNGEMWAMKDYSVDKPWTMMLALRGGCSNRYGVTDEELRASNKEVVVYKKEDLNYHQLMFTLNNGEEMLTWQFGYSFVCYSIENERRRVVLDRSIFREFDCGIAYNPSFVSLEDVAQGEELIK